MTTPTPEQLEAMLGVLAEGEAAALRRLPEGVADTLEQPLRHASSIWADETCGEETGDHHLKHKGDFLEAEGWDDDAELDINGYKINPAKAMLGVLTIPLTAEGTQVGELHIDVEPIIVQVPEDVFVQIKAVTN